MSPIITPDSATRRVKYPRTPHLPWSPGATPDDLALDTTRHFEGVEVVVTEKMDGENTTLYRDGLHARSLSSGPHPSRDWVRRLQAEVGYLIPDGWRVCGENLFARHSLAYEDLPSWLMVFSIWDHTNRCLPWDDTLEWAALLGLEVVPTLYRGPWDARKVRSLPCPPQTCEGYVVRTADGFPFQDFPRRVAKYVRPHHVQTDEHWMLAPVIPNKRRGE
jgi:hypothetical protein